MEEAGGTILKIRRNALLTQISTLFITVISLGEC